MKWKCALLILAIAILAGCQPAEKQKATQYQLFEEAEDKAQWGENMKLTSTAFENNGEIPSEFTCDSDNISPPLSISEVPENAKSLALIMDDPDAPAGTWVHWVVWNIPPDTREIEKGTEPRGVQGKTDFGSTGYGGPCPPSGTHRYFFKLYALDTELSIPEGSTKQDLEKAMEGHIMEKAQLMGTYKRQ
jgi:hypothetical protein